MFLFDPSSIAGFIADNSGYVALILFVLLFCEALLGLGYFLPAATVLLSAGALIGSGVIPPWLAFLGATGGAYVGGEANYWLGHKMRHRLAVTWPFSRYSTLLPRCQAFITRHGGKSLIFGRFSKPLRPTITAVAGMLQMPLPRFRLFNGVAALLWVIVWLGGGTAMTAVSGFEPEQAVTLAMGLLLASIIIAAGALQMEKWRKRKKEAE